MALRPMPSFGDVFLYASRPVDPFTLEFPKQSAALNRLFDTFEQHRHQFQITLAMMFGLLAAIMLLSAVWLGLAFTNGLVAPIRRLIAATDQVSAGNFYVQVPVRAAEGDLAHLGSTFNKMTSELRQQQNRLIAANHLMDERRVFTEAVLSGVPAAVIGVGARGDVTVLNPSARLLVCAEGEEADEAIGRPLTEVLPELGAILQEARGGYTRMIQRQISLSRGGRERTYNVRITPGPLNRGERTFVATLDDMTDLVSRAAHLGLGRRGAAHRPRDQESADADPALGRAPEAQIWPGHHGGQGHFRPVHRHDHPAGRRHQAHGGRILVLLAHAQGAAGDRTICAPASSRSCS